jgi:PIN domain nuclease of toxin-antitoxin system
MIVAVSDTHALLWSLYDDPRLSGTARSFLTGALASGDMIAVSSITLVEIVYLVAKGRVPAQSLERGLDVLNRRLLFAEVSVDHAVARRMASVSRRAVPDMPDRIIAATALHLGVPLISRDGRIRLSAVPTIW